MPTPAALVAAEEEIADLDPGTAFAKESETARKLVNDRGEYWEFLLTEELLRTKLQILEAQYADFDQLLLSVPKQSIGGLQFIPWIGDRLGELSPLVTQMSRCFTEEIPASWGKPGESGDPIQILISANALVSYVRAYMSRELEICAAQPPAKLRRLRDSLRGVTGSLINDLKGATDQLGRAISDVRNGSKEFRVNFDFTSPPQLKKFTAEMEKVTKNPEWAKG
jgi:hypothetical protein